MIDLKLNGENIMSTIGERIRKLRKHYNLNQKDFAKRITMSYSHISNIETGKDKPSDAIIKLLIIEYGTNETWLRTGEGNMLNNSEYNDYSSLTESSLTAEQELIELLKNSSATNKTLYTEMLSSVISLIKINKNLSDTEELDRLETTNVLFEQIANYNLLLQDLVQRNYTDTDLKRIDNLSCELNHTLETYKNIFLKKHS